MRLALACCSLVLASCLEPSLDTCADLTCPPATECVMVSGIARCASAEQRDVCLSLTEGDACTFAGMSGVCRDRVCLNVVCGDRIVDPGESCDDGGTAPGDGCSERCQEERCGNGVTDPGEGCDCGDTSATPRPECNGHRNSDTDELSPCRSACTLRHCGDGVLDPLEQCDGSVPASVTCAALGYHATANDTLACSPFCRFDAAGCSGGICGDGIVNGGEACDGTAYAMGTSCAQFGFYDTDPTHNNCTSACTFSTTACRHTCGDGVRDQGFEQCDGTDLGTATCQSFGFYRGTPGCSSFCGIDTASCAGRCNDGVVDSGEFCDPGASAEVQGYCTDYGYSTGSLSCSQSCGPAFTTCRSPNAFTELFLGIADFIGLVQGPASTAWAAGTQRLLYFSGSEIETYAVTSPITDLYATGSAAAIAMNNLTVRFHDATGPTLTITSPMICTQIALTAPDRLLCIANNAAAWWVNGTWGPTFVTGAGAPADAIARPDGRVMFSDYSGCTAQKCGGVWIVDGTSTTAMGGLTNQVLSFEHLNDGYYGGVAYGGITYGTAADPTYHLVKLPESGGTWSPPIDADTHYFEHDVGGLRLYAGSFAEGAIIGSGVNRRSSGPLGSDDAAQCVRAVTLGAGALCLTPFGTLVQLAGASISQRVGVTGLPAGTLVDTYMDENDAAYFASNAGVTTRSSGGAWNPSPTVAWRTIIGRSSTAILLIGSSGSPETRRNVAFWNGTSFATTTTATDVVAAAMDANGRLVLAVARPAASGFCDLLTGPITSLAPTGSPIECPRSIWITATGAIWLATKNSLWRLGSPTFNVAQDGFNTDAAIRGTDDSHIWAAIGHNIYFWNGTAWTIELHDATSSFDWLDIGPTGAMIATAGLQTWTRSNGRWTKFRLPSDPTPFLHPILRPWGVYFRTPNATAAYAVWQQGWP